MVAHALKARSLVSRAAGTASRAAARVSRVTAPGGAKANGHEPRAGTAVEDGRRPEERAVERAYRLLLGRPADPEGLALHGARLAP